MRSHHFLKSRGPAAVACAVLCCSTAIAATVPPLPRVAVIKEPGKPGQFRVRDTGAPFYPQGFNHTVLEHGDSGWHATFNVGVYDPQAMDATLAAMTEAGANTVRIWAWGVQQAGGFTDAESGVNPAYMDHFIDFLRRAARHRLYVIPILDETPQSPYYHAIARAADERAGIPPVPGRNGQYLNRGLIAAKRACAMDFVGYIRENAPEWCATIPAWSLANEVCVTFTNEPFNRTAGIVTLCTGKQYDMNDREQRQACYDESILYWANELASGIKEADPHALVTTGMWTADAHGRPPRNGLWPDDKDPRIPPRPSVLAGPDSRLDFIDVHIYPWDGTSKVLPEAHEWDAVLAGRIPAIVGEYGVFKNKSIDEARVMIREMLEQAYAMGYIGDLHWIWDLTGVPGQTWSAVEENLASYLMRFPRPIR